MVVSEDSSRQVFPLLFLQLPDPFLGFLLLLCYELKTALASVHEACVKFASPSFTFKSLSDNSVANFPHFSKRHFKQYTLHQIPIIMVHMVVFWYQVQRPFTMY